MDRRGGHLLIDHDAAAAAVCDRDGDIRHADRRPPASAAGWRELWPALLATVREGGEPDGILAPLGGASITSPLPDDFLQRWNIPERGSTPGSGRT